MRTYTVTDGIGFLGGRLLVVAFEGWNDAGEAATGAVRALLQCQESQKRGKSAAPSIKYTQLDCAQYKLLQAARFNCMQLKSSA